jgi:hypothetical protein
MRPKILFTTIVDDLDQQARDMAPDGFELIVAPQFSEAYTATLPQAEYLVGNVHNMDDGFYRTGSRLRLVRLVGAG